MKRIQSPRVLLLAAGALLACFGLARGQLFPEITSQSEGVVQLRQALRLPVRLDNVADLQFREKNVARRIDALHSVSDLGQALLLHEWQPAKDQDERLVRLQSRLAEKFVAAARTMLGRNNPRAREATAHLIGDIGTDLLAGSDFGGDMRPLTGDLVRLLQDPDLQVRLAAVEALGKINPEAEAAVPALTRELTSDRVEVRRAAASALGNLLKKASTLVNDQNAALIVVYRRRLTEAIASSVPLSTDPGSWLLNEAERSTTGEAPSLLRMLRDGPPVPEILVTRFYELVRLELAVIPVAARGAGDSDAEVRRQSLDALSQAALAISNMTGDPRPPTDFPPEGRPPSPEEELLIRESRLQIDSMRDELLPIGRAFERQVPAFRKALVQEDTGTRLAGRQALVQVGFARWKLQRRAAGVPPFERPRLPKDQDPILGLYRGVLPQLDEGFADPDLQIRLTTVQAVEWLGEDAVMALDSLAKGLEDSNVFVRWATVRTLGRIAPADGEKLVPAMAQQFDTRDLDLRMITAVTLERYGAHAEAAIPALRRSIFAADQDMRKAAIAALVGMGPDVSSSAIPDIIKALDDDIDTVRRAAADALGKYGPLARAGLPALSKMQESDTPENRRAATNAILEILPPPKEK
jgi:HEAT repeat protein